MQVVEAIVDMGKRLGVTFRLSTPVSSISLSSDSRRATGVVLASGEQLAADVVICNADLVYAYNKLLPPTSQARSLSKREGSCSSISFYWALSGMAPALKAHNIFLADEYRESFDSIFKQQGMPRAPSFYVNVPSRVDASAAPPFRDAVVVLCPVGHLLDDGGSDGKGLAPQDWTALVARAREAVLKTVEARTGVALAPLIAHEQVNTPETWRTAFNLDKGAILGLSHSFFNVLSFRPRTKHAGIEGLYFVGASTHPGTGVPIVLAGSRITSEQVLEGQGMAVPWREAVERRSRAAAQGQGKGGSLDEVRVGPVLSWLHWAALALLVSMLLLLVQVTWR